MKDALTQMDIALKMKNVDEEDQAQAAMLADALISKVMRTHGVVTSTETSTMDGKAQTPETNSEDLFNSGAIFRDPSLWRAHSVLAEVSQIGVWSHHQQQQHASTSNMKSTESVGDKLLSSSQQQPQSKNNSSDLVAPVVTDMKFENYMREPNKLSEPFGGWEHS